MLELRPNKTKSTEQIRAEIERLLQTLNDYDVRVVKGFVERLAEKHENAAEMEVAA